MNEELTKLNNLERLLSNLVRQGEVSVVDAANRRVRVIDRLRGDTTSGWLYVLQHPDAVVSVDSAGSHTHSITDSTGGAGTAGSSGAHTHSAVVKSWMPAMHDRVLVMYLPVDQGDGFVLGVI